MKSVKISEKSNQNMNVLAEKFHMSKQSIVSLILANVLVSDVLELLRMELDNAAIAESDRQNLIL